MLIKLIDYIRYVHTGQLGTRHFVKLVHNGLTLLLYLDNYEWQEGYKPEAKFGLFRIDRNRSDDGQQHEHQQKLDFTRHITKGAEAFKIIVEESFNWSKSGVISDSAILKAKEKFGIVMANGSNVTY